MLYCIFSDVHSNLQALESFLKIIDKIKPHRIICLGDIVGYGANPQECIEKVSRVSHQILAGNHDWACCGKFSLSYFNAYAYEAILWTASMLNSWQKEFLCKLPLIFEEKEYIFVHASLDKPGEFNYIFSPQDASLTFSKMEKKKICFIGHTHLPGVFSKDSKGGINYIYKKEIELYDNHIYIVNVGSIGQPRDGNPCGCFCLFDERHFIVRFIRFEYNVKEAQIEILSKGLPQILAQRLGGGW